jgi:hypothetical protein
MKEELIALEIFCHHFKAELTFVKNLSEFGLVELVEEEDKIFIPSYEIGQLERLTRLHYDVGINLEGLEAIQHLLEKLKQAQEDLKRAEIEIAYWKQLAK